MSLTPGTSTRLHSITLPQVEALDRNESPAPRPRASQPALARARPPPLGNSHPIPFLRALPRTRIRTGSLATPCGSREILALIGTRALTRNSATYTEICTLPRSTPRHRARFCARQPPSYPSPIRFTEVQQGEGTPPVVGTLAFHFRSAPVRLVSCNTLLSGCRLSRPPPSCLDEPNSFRPPHIWHLRRPRG